MDHLLSKEKSVEKDISCLVLEAEKHSESKSSNSITEDITEGFITVEVINELKLTTQTKAKLM